MLSRAGRCPSAASCSRGSGCTRGSATSPVMLWPFKCADSEAAPDLESCAQLKGQCSFRPSHPLRLTSLA